MHRRLSAQDGPVGTSSSAKGFRRPRRGTAGCDDRPQDLLFLPQGYEPGYRYPLIVWLPDVRDGGVERFSLVKAMTFSSIRNFVAVLPRSGLEADPERAVWRAMDRACREASVHPGRIYLVGARDGGTEAFRIGCRHPGSFAGIVSLGGAFPFGETAFSRLAEVRRLPMLLCCHRHASEGPINRPSMDRTLRLFHAAGASLSVRIYPESRTLSKAMLGDVNRWVMEDVCGTVRPLSPILGGA